MCNMKTIAAAVMLMAVGTVQAEVVGLNTFANEYVGANVTATLSQAATNGFKVNYDTVASGNSFVITSAGVSGGPKTLAVGQSAVLSFTYTSAKISTLDLGFRWGLDFGDTSIQMRADTASSAGAYGATFFRESYVTANGSLTNASGAVNTNWALGTEPSSNFWFKGGNSNVTVVTTVTRVSGNDYSIDVLWGGNTYSSVATTAAAIDGTIDGIFFGHGKESGGGVAVGDNYVISDLTLNVIPEPATISMLGIGAVLVLMARRSRRS